MNARGMPIGECNWYTDGSRRPWKALQHLSNATMGWEEVFCRKETGREFWDLDMTAWCIQGSVV